MANDSFETSSLVQIKSDLPDIHLKDIGKKKGGASAAEVANEIVAALYSEIQSPVVTDALKEQMSSLGGVPAKAAEQALKGAGGVVEGAGEEAGSVTEKVKGLFKKE